MTFATQDGEVVPPVPVRQIRAHHDNQTITVYQAYNSPIATAAVETQRLDSSPSFKLTRMTWIKPSWGWMLYRSGYSYKEAGQERILALQMTHESFINLLRKGVLSHSNPKGTDQGVRVQWDPERSVRLEKLPYRSIQIGIPAAISQEWARSGILHIEDVTGRARDLKRVLDESCDVSIQELVNRGLVPVEAEFDVPEDVKHLLEMTTPPK